MTKARSPLRRPHLSAFVTCAALQLSMLPSASAQALAPEPDLKAAIISNMLLFVEWPVAGPKSVPDDQLVVCYHAQSPVSDALRRLDGKTVKGKLLKVIQVKYSDAAYCHAFYLSPGNGANLVAILPDISQSPVLIAADSPEYAKSGVMLNLDLMGGRVVFDIDLRSAQKAGLQVSSKALRLARQVTE